MIEPEEIELEIARDASETDFQSELSNSIATDRWGNEWDARGEFSDMDFRLVDE